MLEIIAIIFLSKKNGQLAASKGLKSSSWAWISAGAWVLMEFVGAFIGLLVFGYDNIISAYMLAVGMAISSYFIVRNILHKKPDQIEEDEINRIGVDDLRP